MPQNERWMTFIYWYQNDCRWIFNNLFLKTIAELCDKDMISRNDLSIKENKFDRRFKIHNQNEQPLDALSTFPFRFVEYKVSVNRSAKHEYRNPIVIRFLNSHSTKRKKQQKFTFEFAAKNVCRQIHTYDSLWQSTKSNVIDSTDGLFSAIGILCETVVFLV